MNCHYCGKELVVLDHEVLKKKGFPGNLRTKDHVIPKSRTPKYADRVTVDACLECNNNKGSLTGEEWRVVLAFREGQVKATNFKFYGER